MLQTTWKTEYEKSTIFELCTDDNKSKCSSNRKDIFKSAKKIWNSTPSELLQLLLLNLFAKFLLERKYLMNNFNLCEAEISWNHKIYKFWNK